MKHYFWGVIFLFILFISFSSNSLFAQQVEFKKTSQWEFLYEIDGVNFYYEVAQCNDTANSYHREYVLLKLENTNDFEIIADWDVLMYYNGNCFNCGDRLSPEHHRSVVLAGNNSVEGRCFTFGDKTLRIFSSFLNYKDPGSTLTKFELINLNVRQK